MRASQKRAVAFFDLAALVTAPLMAQVATGELTGRVQDEDRAPLPGITITATSPQLQGQRSAVSDGNGNYKLPFLPAGDYRVTYELDGFATGGATATTFYRDHLRPGAGLNRWNINDAMLTQWGEDQSTGLDPDVRKEILRKIWDRETQFLFKGLPKASGMGFNVKNPRLRNYRVGGPLVNVTALGDEGTYMSDAWLDV